MQFEIGILLGLGGVLLCSFLGGMRAITWTQVAQYVVLLLAFLIPVSWLAYKQLGNPLAPLVYGKQLQKITEIEKTLDGFARPKSRCRRSTSGGRPNTRRGWRTSSRRCSASARRRSNASASSRRRTPTRPASLRPTANWPRCRATEAGARELWTRAMHESHERAKPLGGLPPHGQAFAGDPDGTPAAAGDFRCARAATSWR